MPLLIYQGRLNLLDRAPQEEGITEYCKENGIGFISFSPLAQGLLTEKYLNEIPEGSRMSRGRSLTSDRLTDELYSYLNRLKEVADSRDEDMAQTALTWLLSQEGVTSALVGASSTNQLLRNIRSIYSLPFTKEENDLLK